MFDPNIVNKKVQYITVDSEFVISSNATVGGYTLGGNNNFSVNFGNSSTTITSNIFMQEMRNVIGLKLVDFYVTQVATIEPFQNNVANTSPLAVKYIDVLCQDLPDQAQILDERKSKIFARIPLERDFSGSSNIIVNDKQWKSFNRQTNYFNPISIKSLGFQMWELTGQNTTTNPYGPGVYQPLQPDAQFYMVLEVTTVDYDAITLPSEDPQMKVVEAIQSLEEKIVSLLTDAKPQIIEELQEPEPEPELQEPEPEPHGFSFPQLDENLKLYILIALIAILAFFVLSSRR
jgi:hypothetical protein